MLFLHASNFCKFENWDKIMKLNTRHNSVCPCKRPGKYLQNNGKMQEHEIKK